ncbi:unknown [Ruminococcus sp. CAG:379]|nr:unknown [Ruminococcus sp. CAG:379]
MAVQVIGVVADLNASGLQQSLDFWKGQIGISGYVRILLRLVHNVTAHHGDHSAHVVLFQQGQALFQIVVIAVVKGDHHRLFRQGLSVVYILHQIGHQHCLIAMVGQIGKVTFQHLRGDNIVAVPAGKDAVIHQNRQGDPIFSGIRYAFCPERAASEQQHQQPHRHQIAQQHDQKALYIAATVHVHLPFLCCF